jgi:hypothetical protein
MYVSSGGVNACILRSAVDSASLGHLLSSIGNSHGPNGLRICAKPHRDVGGVFSVSAHKFEYSPLSPKIFSYSYNCKPSTSRSRISCSLLRRLASTSNNLLRIHSPWRTTHRYVYSLIHTIAIHHDYATPLCTVCARILTTCFTA